MAQNRHQNEFAAMREAVRSGPAAAGEHPAAAAAPEAAATTITVEHVSVAFPIYDARGRSMKNRLISMGTGGRIGTDSGHVMVHALDDVSLRFTHGDRVGLVGHNGAGKTTLLRVLSGIYEPLTGSIRCTGRVAALIDIGLGMDEDSTAYENIRLAGLYLGLAPEEIGRKTAEIAAFTELGDYLDMPVRTYSSGMRLRLAFAISTSIEPDILLIDEWVSAGDAAFVEKSERRLAELVERSGILVIASHSEHLIRRICNKTVLFERGRVAATGPVDEVLDTYRRRA
jgi:ABC-2 type transport system ATP-binding protein/lipopolysaccharide transport system ATP-binding protein